MAGSYETAIPEVSSGPFQEAITHYMIGPGFIHPAVGERPDRYNAHEFNRRHDFAGMTVSNGGMNDPTVVVHASCW